jgi:hypothetical protein
MHICASSIALASAQLQSLQFRAKVWVKPSGIALPERPHRNEKKEDNKQVIERSAAFTL